MSRRQTLWNHLRWDSLALAILVVVALGYRAVQNPRFQPTESPTSQGSKPPDRTEADVLLLLPSAPAATANEFDSLDCSFSWFNALGHHFGPFATAPADSVTPQLLAGHAVAVVPGRVAADLSSAVRGDLEAFTRQGGQLIVEMPRRGWEHLTGVSTVGELTPARSITAVEGLGIHGPYRDNLIDAPLAGRLLPTADLEARPDGPVVFEVEEQPGLLIESLGEGHVYSLLFDFACSLLAMHQGRPTQEMNFGPPDRQEWMPTSYRVAYEHLLATDIPYAHVLHRALFDRLPEMRPLPRLWAYPGTYKGAAMTQHPAQTSPRAAFGYADRSRQQEAFSTIFAAPDYFTPHHGALARETGADVGLVWVLGKNRPPIVEGVGIGALKPWVRELSLPHQQALLKASLPPETSASLVQTEGTLWQTDWDSTFRTLAGAGLSIDASFGPSEPSQFGFLFGTGMPFYPLDKRGLPLPLKEAPFVLDGAGLSTERLLQLLTSSSEVFHQPLMVNLSTDAMRDHPSTGTLLGFKEFHDLAREHDHWLTTVNDFVDFLAMRNRSILTSQWSNADRRLTISINLLGSRLVSASDGAIPSIAIPAQFDDAGIDRIDVDDEAVTVSSLARSGPGDEVLLELPPGRHVISVFYASPPLEEDD